MRNFIYRMRKGLRFHIDLPQNIDLQYGWTIVVIGWGKKQQEDRWEKKIWKQNYKVNWETIYLANKTNNLINII